MSQAVQSSNRRAFTLIELSIVLVILGLLVGSVLAGKSLIDGAEKKAQVAQNTTIAAAVLAFKDKYLYLPGDLPNATAFWNSGSQPTQVTNGNGDGKIGRTDAVCGNADCTATTSTGWCRWSPDPTVCEQYKVFDHLSAAGLINFGQYDETNAANYGIGIGIMPMKFKSTACPGGVVVGYETGLYHIHSGHKIRWTYGSNNGFNCGMSAQDAWEFDTKMDDGLPLSGKFYVTGAVYMYRVPGDVNDEVTNWCVQNGAGNQYYLNNTSGTAGNKSCTVDIDAPF